jgi:N-acetylneuraminic acid mutarotase
MRPIPNALATLCAAALLAACSGGGDSETPPAVSDRAPASGAVDAAETYVMVKFSEPMDAGSLSGGISVSRVGGGPVEGAVSASGDLAYFIPSTPFPAAASLKVTVSADVRSAAGARLGAPVSWSFTTAHWREVSATGAPTARSGHTAVWTGSEVIVWGGTPGTLAGGRYDPASDSWAATSTTNAPAPRTRHAAVWTGTEMIVWGGLLEGTAEATATATGGRYDPATNSWRSVSTNGAPSARSGHTAVWTGTEMIVWGGAGQDLSGGRYDPATDTWSATSLTDPPQIDGGHRAAWTGEVMAVWGGTYSAPTGDGAGVVGGASGVQTGALYDPASDTWSPTTAAGAPSGRSRHVLVWSGFELIVWGGGASTGGRYAVADDAWTATAEAGAPAARADAHAAWTGSRLLVWSGVQPAVFTLGAILEDGALFDPATDSWTPVSTAGAASALQRGAASAWTGSELVVWGGESTAGARFTP